MFPVKETDNLSYAKEFGTDGLFDAYLPETDEAVPALIYLHGGGLCAGDKESGNPIFRAIAAQGIAVFSANYRMMPKVQFPVFVEDSAKVIGYLMKNAAQFGKIDRWYVGGSSAGGWLSMMLAFDAHYLAAEGIDCRKDIAGYLFDAGQPTAHFNVLESRGFDPRTVRLDETAPLAFIDREPEHPEALPIYQFIVAENDMFGRLEQNLVMMRTMEHFKYDTARIHYRFMPGFTHCGYLHTVLPDGRMPFAEIVTNLIFNGGDDRKDM